jgi:HK97 family phage portal protein
MGGDEMGQPDHRGLKQTLELNKALLEGVAKAMNSSYQVNGVIKYNTMMDKEKMEKAIMELEDRLRKGESGFLATDLKAEFIPFQKQLELVDNDTLEFIDSKILRNWGVPLCILKGDYSREQYAAFYQKCLEPIIISFSQAMTKKIFTRREIAFGNKVKLYPKELVFMTTSQVIEMIKELSPTGALFENEKRAALGMMPNPELEGKRYMSLNWIDANNAAQYQVGLEVPNEVNIDVVDKEDV